MVGIGLVGAGAFGEFCLDAFAAMDDVQIVAIADVNIARAQMLADRFGARAYPELAPLLANEAVSIVALNTPPALHAEQGVAVLNGGKHLFCEKPLATNDTDGKRLIAAAVANHVLLTVDYVMRYNPFWAAAASLRASSVFGTLRHIDLANHANGLSLPASHWFWNKQLSGGIWVEHGVHFFDAIGWVTGQVGQALSAHEYTRTDGKTDRVEGLFRYGDTAVHCYHAFDQSGETEQTTVRLTFEHAYLTLREWVPTSLEVQTRIDPKHWREHLHGTIKENTVYAPEGKSVLYRESIQAGMRNLIAASQGTAALNVSGADGLASLQVATAAEALSSETPLGGHDVHATP